MRGSASLPMGAGLQIGLMPLATAQGAHFRRWLGLLDATGALSLMFVMIRRGQSGQVARQFFLILILILILGVSARLGLVLLGERPVTLAVAGFGLHTRAACVVASKR
jgi:hypothetical protein